MTEKCMKCGAPAFGSVNGQGFCSDHVDDVVAEAMKPAKQVRSGFERLLADEATNAAGADSHE